ncbi:MAG: hydantoinase/oxoprolinase family protein, partial [Methylococcales bacterium]
MLPETIIGWDIGGAHVKVAVLHKGCLVEVAQHACALWQGITRLEEVVCRILQPRRVRRIAHAVTMTGESADCFAGRDEGVRRILEVLRDCIAPECLYIFAGIEGLLAFEQVQPAHYPKIASANWLATGRYVASRVDSAILIDIGSTTTDLLLMEAGQVQAKAFSDFDRLACAELVYTGIVRTPIAALCKQIFFDGQCVPLMAEFFATTADVYRLTGELPEDYDQWPAADGAEKSIAASARRLARMIGRDADRVSLPAWKRLAAAFKEQQLRQIQDALLRLRSRLKSENPVIVGAGIGRFLAAELGRRCGLE